MASTQRKLFGLPMLASGFLVLSFVVLFVLFSRSWYQVEVNVQAPQPTALRVFWTTPGSPFSVDRSTATYVTSERQRYRLLVKPEKKNFHLQFKVNKDTKRLDVRSLTVSRTGRESQRLEVDGIAKRMFVVGGNRGSITDDVVRFDKRKSWLLLRIDSVNPGEKSSSTGTAVLLLAGMAIVAVACALYLFSGAAPVHWLSYVVIALGLILFVRWSRDLLPLPMYVFLFALGLALLGLRVLLAAKAMLRGWKADRGGEIRPYRAVLPALFLGLICYAGLRQLPMLSGFNTGQLFELSEFREARDRFDGFFKDNFSFKNELIGVNSEIKFSLLKSSPVQKMMVGQDGFVFEGRGERRVEGKDIRRFNNFADYMGQLPLTEVELKQWATVLEERRAYLQRQGIAYVFAIAPTKNMIYPEKLPRRFQGTDYGPSRYDQLSSYLKENTTIPFVDLRDALLRAKAKHDYPNLYYRVDFHWNYFGAYFAYREIVEVVNQHYPELKLQPLELTEFSPDVESDWIDRSYLHALGLKNYSHHADQYVRMRPLSVARFPGGGMLPDSGVQDTPIPNEELFHNDQSYVVKVLNNPVGELPGMVIFGDSFILKTMLYFSVHAKRVAFKRTVFEFPKRIVEGEKPRLVVQEMLNMYILHNPPEL